MWILILYNGLCCLVLIIYCSITLCLRNSFCVLNSVTPIVAVVISTEADYHSWWCSICRYEDGDTILRKVSSAADFIWSENPLDILGSVTSITFDDVTSLPIKDHALTTEEVAIYFSSLLFAVFLI